MFGSSMLGEDLVGSEWDRALVEKFDPTSSVVTRSRDVPL
jgi:hypothetical protein